MDTIFMNSGNDKASDPNRLLTNLSNKINFINEVIDLLFYQVLAFITHGKTQKKIIKQKQI